MTRISRSGEEEIMKPVSERERPAVLSLFSISIRWVRFWSFSDDIFPAESLCSLHSVSVGIKPPWRQQGFTENEACQQIVFKSS